jgi:hypothetical protein
MEPSPGADPGLLPYRGRGHSRVRRRGTGASDGGRFRFTDQRESPCLRRCWVSSAGVGPALSATSTLRLLPKLGYEDVEPPPGADPGHPPYEGGAAAVRGGVSWGIKIRT